MKREVHWTATSTLAYEEKNAQVLRIAASDVAAVAGYNEWVDLRELFLGRLLYQDLGHILRRDATNLDLELEDKEQRSERLLAKAGEGELMTVRTRAGDGAAVATVQDARALRDKALSLVKKAEGNKRLSRDEAKELKNDLRHDINTKFGTRNEDVALLVYERRTGTEVFCRNERILVWPFPGARHGEGVPDGSIDPPRELSEGWTKKESRSFKRAEAKKKREASEASFASAVASCLTAVFPARGALERAVEHTPFTTGGADANDSNSNRNSGSDCSEPTATAVVQDRGSVVADEGIEIPEGGAAGVALLVGVRSASKNNGDGEPPAHRRGRRQLVPGVPWPEWRGSNAPILRDKPVDGRGEETVEILPEIEGALAGMSIEQGAGGWTGELGLWFASCLSPRQRAAVHQAAGERGLRHESVAVGVSGGNAQLVVWEPAAAQLPVARKRSLPLPASAASGEGVAAENPAKRRASAPLPLEKDIVVPFSNDGGGGGDTSFSPTASGMGESAMAQGQPRGARRWSVAGVAAANATVSRQVRDSAAVAGRIKPSRKKSFVRPAAVAVPGFPVTMNGGEEKNHAAVSTAGFLPSAVENGTGTGARRRVGVKKDKVEETAVYAWGEGPTPEEDQREVEESAEAKAKAAEVAGLEPSVWSRRPSLFLPAESVAAGLGVPSHLDGDSHGDGEVGARDVAIGGADLGVGTAGAGSDSRGGAPAASGGDSGGTEGASVQSLRERRKTACFVVVGAVDGIAEEVVDAPEGADTWETRKVVVEVKNRMSAAKVPPPLYDQIQLVTYMLMIGATTGDLVQFVKTGAGGRNGGRSAAIKGAAVEQATRAAEDNVTVSRVELDCRAYHHKRHWEHIVLPRLYSFARMVYQFRGDDLLRWRYLLASPEEQRAMLVECCPYLDSVIPRVSLPQPMPPAAETAAAAAAAAAASAASPPSDSPPADNVGNYKTATELAEKKPAAHDDDQENAELPPPGIIHETAAGAVSGNGQTVRSAEEVVTGGEAVELPTRKRAKGGNGVAIDCANTDQK